MSLSPGGEPSVGSVYEVNRDRISVGREWRVLESVREWEGAVEAWR